MLYDAKTPFRSMVDAEVGTVARPIFIDEQIYQLELERIFARAWNFMCHESQIPNPGDFFLSYIGEESVICTRDKSGKLQAFLNSCRHRGNAVCRAEQGNTRSFLCTYHGWTYDLAGKLIGVPGYKDLYHEQLDRSQWGLISAGKVAAYKGFVFATMDPNAPDLDDYLGPVGQLALDLVASRGSIQAVGGVQKYTIGCNWKFATDNCFDYYHGAIAHASAGIVGAQAGAGGRPDPNGGVTQRQGYDAVQHRVVLGDYGHAISGPHISDQAWSKLEADGAAGPINTLTDDAWRTDPRVREELGDMVRVRGHRIVFPNLWVVASTSQVCLRIPKGPAKTELWWFTLVPEEFNEEQRHAYVHSANHRFGAAGILEQEDGENWDQSTRAMKGPVAQRYPLNYQLNMGHGEVKRSERGLAYVDTLVNEHGAIWIYQAWADWMDAENWDALKREHTAPPLEGVVV
jgi:phenylpropionate dioxygenase-like ring-hydroxylating dioxygenase large terminal subunit